MVRNITSALSLSLIMVGTAYAQPASLPGAPVGLQAAQEKTVPNPFKNWIDASGKIQDHPSGIYGFGMDMGGMDGMGMGMGGMDDMGMDMGGMGMPPAPPKPSFQDGVRQAIQMLRQSRTEKVSTRIREYIRVALEGQYDEGLQQRKLDLERLRQGIVRLEADLKRRQSAKKRVIDVQMQSIELASEGLLQMESNSPSQMMGMGGMGMGGSGSDGSAGLGGELVGPGDRASSTKPGRR